MFSDFEFEHPSVLQIFVSDEYPNQVLHSISMRILNDAKWKKKMIKGNKKYGNWFEL